MHQNVDEDINNKGSFNNYDEEIGEEDEEQDNNVWCICQQVKFLL